MLPTTAGVAILAMLNSAPIVMDRPEVPHPEPAALAGGLEQASAVFLREQNGVVGAHGEVFSAPEAPGNCAVLQTRRLNQVLLPECPYLSA